MPWQQTTLTKYAFTKTLEVIFSKITPLNFKISTFLVSFGPKFSFEIPLALGTCGKYKGPFLRHGCKGLKTFALLWIHFTFFGTLSHWLLLWILYQCNKASQRSRAKISLKTSSASTLSHFFHINDFFN